MLAIAVSLGLGGCGSPLLHPAATPGQSFLDPGLVGDWRTSDADAPTQVRLSISGPAQPDQPYRTAITLHHDRQLKTALDLDVTLTELNGVRFADLFLARSERDRLVEYYGFLTLPTHQLMKLSREGDMLTVWAFDGNWLTQGTEAQYDRVTVGGDDIVLVTAPTAHIRDTISRHASDPRAFGAPMVFKRTSR
jgi:hypothetical protein